ncbi:MAG: VTC domain-containing protein [Bdellovibrionota bacterium]
MSAKALSPLNLDRYELKYRIPIHLIDPITDYVNQYCEMDYYSQISPGGYYVINSLYMDNISLFMMRRPLSTELDYSSFRIRSYGLDPKPPYYLESKQKIGDFCKKRRSKVPIENISDLFHNPSSITSFDPYADKNMRDFLEKSETFGLEPQILTQYRRRAWLSRHDEYARVTIDRDLRYMEEHSYNVIPDESRMTHYDHNETFEDYNTSRYAILELKCERKIPLWMVQIVRTFETTWDPFSKFYTGMMECYGNGTEILGRDLISTSAARDLGVISRFNKLSGGKYAKLFASGQ